MELMEKYHKILCFLEHTDHKIWESAKNSNSLKTLETPVNRAFQFFKPTLSQPKSVICNFEKSVRSHRWICLGNSKCYQETFIRMV